MKKVILFIFIVCLTFGLNCKATVYSDAESNYVKVIYTSTFIYANSESSFVISEVEYGTTFKLKDKNQITGADNLLYYLIEINVNNYSEGYVLCSQVLNVNLSSPVKDLDSNAAITKNADLYILIGNNYSKSGSILNVGEKIKIIDGYNPNEQYTRIQYKDESGNIITAYIRTDTIKTSSISRTTIGAIIIIISTISLVMVLFGVKGKKRKN